jgi:hypothetical protein
MNKATLIERARIMFETVYNLDSTELLYDMHSYSFAQALVVYNSIRSAYERSTGESADVC